MHQVLALTGKPESLIEYVKDRPGHDRRYALSSEKLMRETGWQPVMDFETGLARTIDWYRANAAWVARVRSGEYRTYYERNYGNRASRFVAPTYARGDRGRFAVALQRRAGALHLGTQPGPGALLSGRRILSGLRPALPHARRPRPPI